MMRIKLKPEAKQAGEVKESPPEQVNRIQNVAQHPQVVSGNPQLGNSFTTQKSAMSSTISTDSAEIPNGTAANHPFDGDLVKWTIEPEDFLSAWSLRTIIRDLEKMIEICNLKLQRLEANKLGFWERQAIELGARVQAKTEHPTAPSSAKLSLKRQASPARDIMDKNSKTRVLPAKRSSVRRMKPSDSELTSDDVPVTFFESD